MSDQKHTSATPDVQRSAKHTPGPWELKGWNIITRLHGKDVGTQHRGVVAGQYIIASVNSLPGGEADARLIAAAPDMFAALLEAEVLLHEYPTVERMVKQALAKAEGQGVKS